jgi:hypothetical protein
MPAFNYEGEAFVFVVVDSDEKFILGERCRHSPYLSKMFPEMDDGIQRPVSSAETIRRKHSFFHKNEPIMNCSIRDADAGPEHLQNGRLAYCR